MKVEVLYVADCPTHPAVVNLVKQVLAAEGVEAKIHEVLVRDEGMANELGFCDFVLEFRFILFRILTFISSLFVQVIA